MDGNISCVRGATGNLEGEWKNKANRILTNLKACASKGMAELDEYREAQDATSHGRKHGRLEWNLPE